MSCFEQMADLMRADQLPTNAANLPLKG